MRKFVVLAGKLFKVYGFQMKIRGAVREQMYHEGPSPFRLL